MAHHSRFYDDNSDNGILRDLGGAVLFPQEFSPIHERKLLSEIEKIQPFSALIPTPRNVARGTELSNLDRRQQRAAGNTRHGKQGAR